MYSVIEIVQETLGDQAAAEFQNVADMLEFSGLDEEQVAAIFTMQTWLINKLVKEEAQVI